MIALQAARKHWTLSRLVALRDAHVTLMTVHRVTQDPLKSACGTLWLSLLRVRVVISFKLEWLRPEPKDLHRTLRTSEENGELNFARIYSVYGSHVFVHDRLPGAQKSTNFKSVWTVIIWQNKRNRARRSNFFLRSIFGVERRKNVESTLYGRAPIKTHPQGRGVHNNFCWVCAAGISKPLLNYSLFLVYSVANYRFHRGHPLGTPLQSLQSRKCDPIHRHIPNWHYWEAPPPPSPYLWPFLHLGPVYTGSDKFLHGRILILTWTACLQGSVQILLQIAVVFTWLRAIFSFLLCCFTFAKQPGKNITRF